MPFKLHAMRLKRTSQKADNDGSSQRKRHKSINKEDYFGSTLMECGLTISEAPQKCFASHETIAIIRNLKKILLTHKDYPRNVSEFYSDFEKRCQVLNDFKYYLFPNIVRTTSDNATQETVPVSDSVLKILLSVPVLQNKLIDFVFDKAIDLTSDSQCGPVIQMILKSFSTLDHIIDSNKVGINLINLLDVTSEHMLRIEIITAIPHIIGDEAHKNIAVELGRILNEEHDLTPAILDCFSYLCLSDKQYEDLQKKMLTILMTLSKCNHFPNFVKFLLMPISTSDNSYLEVVQGLRNALCWSTSIDKPEDIASSQILTATAILNSIVSSKAVCNAWCKVISMCKLRTDHKPIDFVIIIILYSTSEDNQKQIENIMRRNIKNNILNEELLDEAFDKYKPIIKEYLKHVISLANSLLKTKVDPVIQNFASHIYTLMFSKLVDYCRTVVAELLHVSLYSKQCVIDILSILNKIALKDMSILKPQSVQMLTLLDRMDDMNLFEIRAVMNLVCGLAYSCDNSVIRDDIHMFIRKELGSSNPTIKMQGILAGVHAVKYLMKSKDGEDQSIELADDIGYATVNYLIEGDLREAAQVIELISHSTRERPDMQAFFYEELYKIIQSGNHINKHFLHYLTDAVTNDLEQNFIENTSELEDIEGIKLTMKYCLNTDSEIDEVIAINIAGITLQAKEDVNILILAPLFQLVQTLHAKKFNGDLSQIDALLGCPIIMPILNIDSVEDMGETSICHILDCLIHCANWFREIVNTFATQDDLVLKSKIFNRISHIHELENLIGQILFRINFNYKPPSHMICLKSTNVEQITRNKSNVKNQTVRKNKELKSPKNVTQEDICMTDTLKSQSTHTNNIDVKNKLGIIQNITFRPLGLNLLKLLNYTLTDDNEEEMGLNIDNLIFILKCINFNLENILISRIKRNTFFSKQCITEEYDTVKAEQCARSLNEVIPKIIEHMTFITSYLNKFVNSGNDNDEISLSNEILKHVLCLEYIFNMYTIYFKWIGFKSQYKDLLKSSLRVIESSKNKENSTILQILLETVTKQFQMYGKYCLQLSTAVSLVCLIRALQEHASNSNIKKMLSKLAYNFLSRKWKTPNGAVEKGLIFNQSVDNFAKVYYMNIELSELKNNISVINETEFLKGNNVTLSSFKCINKANFPILYNNLGSALYETSKMFLHEGLTNLEHLHAWKDVVFILKCMSEMAKSLKGRTLTVFFKKAHPIIRLFQTHGIPIVELEFKRNTQEVLDILETLQQSTRFLQILCRQFRLKKDRFLIRKVPYVKQLLEILVYKVKAVLAANDYSEAFWMGVLKNKNIDGEIIATQQTIQDDESNEDCDDQLPEDESDDSDNEILNPDSRSVSDIV